MVTPICEVWCCRPALLDTSILTLEEGRENSASEVKSEDSKTQEKNLFIYYQVHFLYKC